MCGVLEGGGGLWSSASSRNSAKVWGKQCQNILNVQCLRVLMRWWISPFLFSLPPHHHYCNPRHLSSAHRFGRARPAQLGAPAIGHFLCDARRVLPVPGARSRPQPRHPSTPDTQHHSARGSFTRYRAGPESLFLSSCFFFQFFPSFSSLFFQWMLWATVFAQGLFLRKFFVVWYLVVFYCRNNPS